MIREFEGYRWDAVSLNENWRPAKSEIWETHQGHIFMGAGKNEIKHGSGIQRNKKWPTIMVNRHRIKLMNVYGRHTEYADFSPARDTMIITLRKCTEQSRSTRNPAKKSIQIEEGDFNAELGPGYGVMADDTELHGTQHDVQKHVSESKLPTDRLEGQRNKLITC